MLAALRISNFAVIEEAEVSFGPGLTVLTGETGAGKSILVDALGLLLGGRGDVDVIRSGAEEAAVEALFHRTPLLARRLNELGLPDLGEEVSVRRVMPRSGRAKAHVNGALVTVGVLAQAMRGLVDIAGQHEHVSLFDPSMHRSLLDRLGGLEPLLERYRRDWTALREAEGRIEGLGGDEAKVRERIEFLRFQLDEIERLAPEPGEDARLEVERRKLGGAEKLRHLGGAAECLISTQDGAAAELVGRALALVNEGARIDPALGAVAALFQSGLGELEEGARQLSRYVGRLESEPERLAEVEDRLDALKRLCRKHGADLGGVLAKGEELAVELARLENRRGLLESFEAERQAAEAAALHTAALLSRARRAAAEKLSRATQSGLADLAMPHSAFEVRVEPGASLHAEGIDEVQFYFAANPGEPTRPLSKVASGGEASRLLLALKRGLADSDACGSYVLDEADAGVSGAVADVVGRMIKEVSANRQVLCITHLPQVAAYADAHLLIEKRQEGGRCISQVVSLGTAETRTRELARMLSGLEVTREALGAAEALVRSALRPKARARVRQSA